MAAIHYLDSITDAAERHRGGVAVSGSHGGAYPAAVASRAGLRAVIFNDAGRGLDEAGVAGVLRLDDVGMAAAAADAFTCRIGDAGDTADNGVLSVVNAAARALGLAPGDRVAEAAARLRGAPAPTGAAAPVAEARRHARVGALGVALLDSASLIGPEDVGGVVVTGSHGGLIGGDPARAAKADVRIAVFNDAAGGKDGVGFTRLPALDGRGIAGLTVAFDTARIGDAASALENGVISAANPAAIRLGARPGVALRTFLGGL